MGKHFPARKPGRGAAPRVDREHDTLRAESPGAAFDQLRIEHRCRVDRHLVGASTEHPVHIVDRPDATTDRQGDEYLGCRALDDIGHDGALIGRGRDVIKDELVGTFAVIERRERHGIAGIDVAGESNALDDPPVLDVEAGNDTSCQHQ
jgi:hypothetical protein